MSSASTARFEFSPRDLLLLLIAIMCGIGTGLLLWQSNIPLGQAVVGGFTALGGTLLFLDRITKA